MAENVYLSAAQCSRRYSVSHSTWWRWVARGLAPQPYRFGDTCTRWLLSDLEAWESRQVVAEG